MYFEIVFYILTCLIFIVVGFWTYKQAFTTRIGMESIIYWFITVCLVLVLFSSSNRTIRNYLILATLGMNLGSIVKEFWIKRKCSKTTLKNTKNQEDK